MKRKGLLYGLGLFCLAGAVVCGVQLYREWMPRYEAESLYEQIRMTAFSKTQEGGENGSPSAERNRQEIPDFDALTAKNSDIKGWIYAPDTDIDYPIVQAADNDYYLYRTADQNRSIIGSIFMECKNGGEFLDDVTVLYGHHIKGGRMFSSLSGYKTQSYYETHPEMVLYTPDKTYRVLLFAGQVIDGQTGKFPLIFGEAEEREEWLATLMNTSSFQGSVKPEEGERILALCTCSYEYNDARYVVYGVLRDLEEETDLDEEADLEEETNEE